MLSESQGHRPVVQTPAGTEWFIPSEGGHRWGKSQRKNVFFSVGHKDIQHHWLISRCLNWRHLKFGKKNPIFDFILINDNAIIQSDVDTSIINSNKIPFWNKDYWFPVPLPPPSLNTYMYSENWLCFCSSMISEQ